MARADYSDQRILSPRFELLFVVSGAAVMAIVHRAGLAALDPAKWATMSAWLLLIGGVCIAQQLAGRFDQMLQRLNRRGAISLGDLSFDTFLASQHARAKTAGLIGGLLLPGGLILTYALTIDPWDVGLASEISLELASAFVVGRYIGTGIFYAFLGRQMKRDGVKINVIIGHSDEAAGLRPIGDFYFFQCLVTALPVVFFAFWLIMMPFWETLWPEAPTDYATQWKNVYIVFFFLALALELVAFVFPLLYFHLEMQQQKSGLIPKADALSAQLHKLQIDNAADDYANRVAPEPELLIQRIQALEGMPTWPLAPNVRNRFALGNLAFLAAPAAKISQTVLESTGLS